MDLNQIYSSERCGSSQTRDSRTEYQRDFDRIIFSSAFRRLQNKTQVFPLPGSVFVHNRLTHSLEVASVGRTLGNLAGEFIVENFKKDLTKESKQFYKHNLYNVISSACLCHDIGNPAFGHSGEDAIASFFIRNEDKLKGKFTDEQWTDFTRFEGNANGIRILTHAQAGKAESSLGLTFATMVAIAKYPCESSAGGEKEILHRKKFGFFQSEKKSFRQIAEAVGMKKESDNPIIYKRHPFVWLTEAADDICYNIIDLEDSHRLGIIDHDKCSELLLNLLETFDSKGIDKVKNRLKTISDENEKISYLRAKSIGQLIGAASVAYKENIEEILDGSLELSLLEYAAETNAAAGKILDEIERFSIKYIYNHHSVVEIENAGYNVMNELISHFIWPILNPDRSTADKKAVQLIPHQFLYESGTDYEKVMGLLDFISGMTDNYAVELFRRIKGIEIGMRR